MAIVSGGGSGIGRATALELAGARRAGRGRAGAAIEPLRGDRRALARPAACVAHACDIREEDQVDALVDGVLERHGRIDVLVNNAGGQFLAPAEDITPKGFRTVIRLNVEGTWLMTHAVATKAMIPAGAAARSCHVTISPHHGMPGMAHSSAARAAVENLMRVLSIEWARFGIRLNAIAAGQFATETLLTKYPQPMVDGDGARRSRSGASGTADEIAWLVAYLASPAGDFFSGSVLTVDGARDNWYGRWPSAGLADDEGRPLAEARRPR